MYRWPIIIGGAAAVLSGCTGSGSAGPGTVIGVVNTSGAPAIAGTSCHVAICDQPVPSGTRVTVTGSKTTFTTATDRTGHFNVRLPPGSYVVVAGCSDERIPAVVRAGANTTTTVTCLTF